VITGRALRARSTCRGFGSAVWLAGRVRRRQSFNCRTASTSAALPSSVGVSASNSGPG
jgi:hypothetical protein